MKNNILAQVLWGMASVGIVGASFFADLGPAKKKEGLALVAERVEAARRPAGLLGAAGKNAERLKLMSQDAWAAGSTTSYPTSLVTILKAFTDPLKDASNCDGEGGIIASTNCHLEQIGATGVGTITGKDSKSGYMFKVVVSGSSDGYDNKIEAWVDTTAKDGSAYKKFMNYWKNTAGTKGEMEEFVFLPSGEANTGAIKATWDATTQSAATMTVVMEMLSSASNTAWSGRAAAMKLSFVIDISSGDETKYTGEFAGGFTIPYLTTFIGYQVNAKRNATNSIWYGTLYNDAGTALGSGAYDCTVNAAASKAAATNDTLDSQASTLSAMAANSASACKSMASSAFSLSPVAVAESSMGLFSYSGLMKLAAEQ